jgi:hypothetical protein
LGAVGSDSDLAVMGGFLCELANLGALGRILCELAVKFLHAENHRLFFIYFVLLISDQDVRADRWRKIWQIWQFGNLACSRMAAPGGLESSHINRPWRPPTPASHGLRTTVRASMAFPHRAKNSGRRHAQLEADANLGIEKK